MCTALGSTSVNFKLLVGPIHSLPRGGKNPILKVARIVIFHLFPTFHTQNYAKWPTRVNEKDFGVLQPCLKSAQTAKMPFLKWFSPIFLIWPYFGHKNSFLAKIGKFEPDLGSNLGKTQNFEHFGTKKCWKIGKSPKITKKTPNFWPFFSHEFSRKIQNSSFLNISGPLMNVDPESHFTKDYQNHSVTMAQCCPLKICDVIACPTPCRIIKY